MLVLNEKDPLNFMKLWKKKIDFTWKNLSTKIGQMRHLKVIQDEDKWEEKITKKKRFNKSRCEKKSKNAEIFPNGKPNIGHSFKDVEKVLLTERHHQKDESKSQVSFEFFHHASWWHILLGIAMILSTLELLWLRVMFTKLSEKHHS